MSEKVKKSIFKRWWFWLIVVIVVIAIASGGGEDSTETSTTDTSKNTEVKKSDNKAAKEEKKVETVGVGEPLKVGDVVFTINSQKKASNVGGQYGQNAKGEFVILNVTVKNEGKEAITTDSSFFKLLSGDITYEADSTAGIYANDDADFFYQSVNPGIEQKGNIVFDIPKDAKDLTVQVQTGMFGTETGVINLK